MNLWLLLSIPILALCDRVRGGLRLFPEPRFPHILNKVSRKACQFGYGAVIGYMITNDWRLILACSILFWIGEKPSWRQLFNEISGLAYADLYLFPRFMLRGLVWAAPCLVLAYWDIQFLLVAWMALAFALSAYIGYLWQDLWEDHAFTEWSRGAILGTLIVGSLFIMNQFSIIYNFIVISP